MSGLLIEKRDGPVLCLTLNRPERRNALADDLLAALADRLDVVSEDAEFRAVVIDGAGGNFAAGADVRRYLAFEEGSIRSDPRPAIWSRIARCPIPLIAAVEGWCLGAGCELLLVCDIAVAAEDARIGLPEVGLGLIPGAGGTQRLPRAVGMANAALLVLTGDAVSSARALSMGLIAETTASGVARARAVEIARRIADRSPSAVRMAKAALRVGQETGLQQGLDAEREAFATAFAHPDCAEGISAFLERRSPKFAGYKG